MNTLDAVKVTTPYNTEEDCAKFTITDSGDVFKIANTMLSDREYTFSGWVKAESECSFVICQVLSVDSETDSTEYADAHTIEVTTDWQRIVYTFTAETTDLDILFGAGTFYFYHSQLEVGNKATDWTPNPEDVDSSISDVSDQASVAQQTADKAQTHAENVEASLEVLAGEVVTMVRDEDGNNTTLKQGISGWTFSLSDLESTVSSALENIAALTSDQQAALDAIAYLQSNHEGLADYINITSYDGKPCIELGEVGGKFQLRITNTEMYFINEGIPLTTITNKAMVVENISVSKDLQIGGTTYTNLAPKSTDVATVAVFDIASGTPVNASLTFETDYYKLTAGTAANWYQAYVDMSVAGLEVGKTYNFIFDADGLTYDTSINTTVGHFILYDGNDSTLVTRDSSLGTVLHSYTFTATTESARLRWYPASSAEFVSDVSVANVRAIYINLEGTTEYEVVPTYGRVFNDVGYMDGYSLDATGKPVVSSENAVTGYIPIDINASQLLYTRNFSWDVVSQAECYIALYDASLALLVRVNRNNFKKYYGQRYLLDNGDLNDFPISASMFGSSIGSNAAYIRISGARSGSNFIVAINQRPQGAWIWKQRTNGNLGCIWDWKGGSS